MAGCECIMSQQDEKWNYNMSDAPLNTPLKMLSADDCFLLPQKVYIGTIVDNGRFRVKGECIEGDPEYFYRSAIVAWRPISD